MKTLGIGIFILLVMGLLFFTVQVVKNSDFAVVPSPQSKEAEQKTFVDIKANLTFEYPASWLLIPSAPSAQYAPVFLAGPAAGNPADLASQAGYFGVSRKPMKRFKSSAEDIEFYSEDAGFRTFLNETIVGGSAPIEANEITFEKTRQLTLKSGMPGFAVPYSVGNIRGTAYFIYSYDNLIMIVSAFIGNAPASSGGKTIDPAYAAFRAAVDGVMNTFVSI